MFTMNTREFFVLLTGLPMNSMWVKLVVEPTLPESARNDPDTTVIDNPQDVEAALAAAFGF